MIYLFSWSESVFTVRKYSIKFSLHYTFFDILYLTSVKRHNPARLWPQWVQKLPVVIERRFKETLLRSITSLNNWDENPWNVPEKSFISTFFENLTPSRTFSNDFNNSCHRQTWRTYFNGCFCKVFPHFNDQSILVFQTAAGIILKSLTSVIFK